MYKRTRSFRNENNSFKVRSMALSPSEDVLVVALDNSQLFTFQLSSADIRFPPSSPPAPNSSRRWCHNTPPPPLTTSLPFFVFPFSLPPTAKAATFASTT